MAAATDHRHLVADRNRRRVMISPLPAATPPAGSATLPCQASPAPMWSTAKAAASAVE